MMDGPLIYFLVGFAVCFLGTIPFGPINLAVVKTTVDYNAARGTELVVAASLVEVVEALIAIFFGMVISSFLETNNAIRLIIAMLFIVLAIYIFTRKPKPQLEQTGDEQRSFFKKGLLIAALNPQAIPFWIFALTAISQYFEFQYAGLFLAVFLLGVFVGKLAALYGFVIASTYLKAHLQQSSLLVNRILASVLLIIGASQLWNALPIL